jgi:DNA primase
MNVFDLASEKVKLKKVSATHGGEWQGACPDCGGTDRFHVWPKNNQGDGGYWCRGCGKAGDNIQFLIDFRGMSFKDACTFLNISLSDRRTDYTPSPPEKKKPEFTPAEHSNPAEIWQERAKKFILAAQEGLQTNPEALEWLNKRGIDLATAAAAGLGWNLGEDGKDIYRSRKAWGLPEIRKNNGKTRQLWLPRGLVIPDIVDGFVRRVRIRRPEGDPRYYVVPGSSMGTMIVGREKRAFVIVEAELDAIACAAACPLAGAVAMGSLETKPDSVAFGILKGALQILNALDYGDIGGGAKAAERAIKWWKDQFEKCDRWPVPKGKDPGEAFAMGIDLNEWIKAGLPPVMTIMEESAAAIPRNLVSKPPDKPKVNLLKGLPPLLAELWKLLRENPSVKIINTPARMTVLRNDRYVGGRINYLVFREREITEYILNHPAEEITWENLILEI